METFEHGGIVWVKVFVYYNAPFLHQEEIELDGKETPKAGWMNLEDFLNHEEVTFLYDSPKDIVANF